MRGVRVRRRTPCTSSARQQSRCGAMWTLTNNLYGRTRNWIFFEKLCDKPRLFIYYWLYCNICHTEGENRRWHKDNLLKDRYVLFDRLSRKWHVYKSCNHFREGPAQSLDKSLLMILGFDWGKQGTYSILPCYNYRSLSLAPQTLSIRLAKYLR